MKHLIHIPEPGRINVQKNHICAHAEGHLSRIGPHNACADDGHVCGPDTGDPAQEFPPATFRLLKIHSPYLYGHASGHFAHGKEEREAAIERWRKRVR